MTTGAKMQDDPQRVAATTENLARHFGLPDGTTTLELLDWLVCSRAELAEEHKAMRRLLQDTASAAERSIAEWDRLLRVEVRARDIAAFLTHGGTCDHGNRWHGIHNDSRSSGTAWGHSIMRRVGLLCDALDPDRYKAGETGKEEAP